jgi:hypothetical protein
MPFSFRICCQWTTLQLLTKKERGWKSYGAIQRELPGTSALVRCHGRISTSCFRKRQIAKPRNHAHTCHLGALSWWRNVLLVNVRLLSETTDTKASKSCLHIFVGAVLVPVEGLQGFLLFPSHLVDSHLCMKWIWQSCASCYVHSIVFQKLELFPRSFLFAIVFSTRARARLLFSAVLSFKFAASGAANSFSKCQTLVSAAWRCTLLCKKSFSLILLLTTQTRRDNGSASVPYRHHF